MKKINRIILITLIATVLTTSIPPAQAQEYIQLCLVIDGSGSIIPGDWLVIVNGIADAVENNLPHDGTVELSVVQFATIAQLEVAPIIITAANYQTVANTIRAIAQLGTSTATAHGIALGWNTMAASPNFATFDKQIINLATDGNPNIRNNAATTDLDGDLDVDAYDDIIATVNNAELAGLDELDVEGINILDPLIIWFRDYCVRPQPGTIAPPFDPGWIQAVATAEEFAEAIKEKFEMLNGEPVGGELVPVSKLRLVAPYAALALTLTAGVIGSIKKTGSSTLF